VPAASAEHVERCIAEGRPVYPALAGRAIRLRQALDLILGRLATEEAAVSPCANSASRPRNASRRSPSTCWRRICNRAPGQAPLVAAALQVYWNALASQLDATLFRSGGQATGLLPACGSAPVASVVRIGGAEQGLRYLHCSLCDTEWHLPRVQCSNCSNTTDLAYLAIEGGGSVVKAEACDACHSYLKQVYLTKAPRRTRWRTTLPPSRWTC